MAPPKKKSPAGSAAMPSDLKVSNRALILEVFRQGGEYTAGNIADLTGISRQTVMKAVQFFYEKGLLAPAGKGESTEIGGKRPMLFSFSYDKYIMCITMWPGNLNFSLLDMRTNLIDKEEVSISLPDNVESFFALVGTYITDILQRNAVTPEMLYGVSLSTAGTVNYKTNRLKYSSITPAWGTDIPVNEYLRPFIGNDSIILVENAGKSTGRALLWDKSLSNKRILVLFSTWGFSACLIDKGHILSGKDSLIGEVGHMVINPDDEELCGCGSYGCIERLISENRIRSIIRKEILDYPESMLALIPNEQITLKDVFRTSSLQDTFSRHIVDYIARMLSLLIRNITLVFDPNLVVFQGVFSNADEYFDKKLKEYLAEFQYYPADGSFDLFYDKRSLFDLDVLGESHNLIHRFFADQSLYEDG